MHHNGERWYVNDRSLFRRARQWFCWIGGWERANGKGWKVSSDPTPVSVFGGRLVHYGWGTQVRVKSGYLVMSWRGRYAFVSRDGTPSSAHAWLWGWPHDVAIAARVTGSDSKRAN